MSIQINWMLMPVRLLSDNIVSLFTSTHTQSHTLITVSNSGSCICRVLQRTRLHHQQYTGDLHSTIRTDRHWHTGMIMARAPTPEQKSAAQGHHFTGTHTDTLECCCANKHTHKHTHKQGWWHEYMQAVYTSILASFNIQWIYDMI